MKVADLFGAGVPVCALDYGACLAERVRHADNGLLFSTARQLADILFDLFESYPSRSVDARSPPGRRAPIGAGRPGTKGGKREAKDLLDRRSSSSHAEAPAPDHPHSSGNLQY